jgi:hypothetical protein
LQEKGIVSEEFENINKPAAGFYKDPIKHCWPEG